MTESFGLTASGWRTHISYLIFSCLLPTVYCLLLRWPRQFCDFLFFFFGGGALFVPAFELFLEGGAQAFHADVLLGADLDRVRIVLQEFRAARFIGDFDLVEHAEARCVLVDDAFERLVRDFEMLAVIGRGSIDNFQDAVRMGGHAKRALERFDQVVGELADESDGIA